MSKLVLEDARKIIRGAQEKANQLGYKVSVAVVDDANMLLALERQNGAIPISVNLSMMKASTAVLCRRKTSELGEQSLPGKPLYGTQFLEGITILAGGVPISAAGEVVGAVGLSGAAEHDEECALAGIASYTLLSGNK